MRTKLLPLSLMSILAGAAVSLLLPNGAVAQTIPSPYRFIDERFSVGLYAGSVNMETGELGIAPGAGMIFGGIYGFELRGPIGLEGSIYTLRADRAIYEVSGTTTELLGEASTTFVGFDGRIRFTLTGARTWRGLAPYVVGGGGVITAMGGRSPLEEDLDGNQLVEFGTKVVWSGGAGVRWHPSPRVGIRAEAGYRSWTFENPTAFSAVRLPNGSAPLSEERLGGVGVTIGATLGF